MVLAAPAGAVRATASATIVEYASVTVQPSSGSVAVSVSTLPAAAPYAQVTVAFN